MCFGTANPSPDATIKIEPRLIVTNTPIANDLTTGWFVFTNVDSQTEMLRVSKDGFYVRGVKVEQDEQEARKVYEAFTDWMRGISIMK